MPKKGKRRREAHRERKEQLKAAHEGEAAPAAVSAAPSPRREQAPQRAWRQTGHAKKKRGRGGGFPVSPWLAVTPVAVIVIAVIGWVAFSGGGSGGGATGATPTPTEDPRVRGATPAATYNVIAGGNADNAYFAPNSVTVKAGQVFEIVVKNTGDVTHNLTISGPDKQYDTKDDFTTIPFAIEVGKEARVKAKIDTPGSYPFRCAFHPTVEFGNLIVQ